MTKRTMEETLRYLIGSDDDMDRSVTAAMSTALHAYNFKNVLVHMYEANLDDIHDKISDTWNKVFASQEVMSDADALRLVKLALEDMNEYLNGVRDQQHMANALQQAIGEKQNGKTEDVVLAEGEKTTETGNVRCCVSTVSDGERIL